MSAVSGGRRWNGPALVWSSQVVKGGKGLSRADGGDRKGSIGRQTAVKTPSDENRLFDLIEVRKPTAVEGHAKVVPGTAESLSGREPTTGSAADRGVRPTKKRLEALLPGSPSLVSL